MVFLPTAENLIVAVKSVAVGRSAIAAGYNSASHLKG